MTISGGLGRFARGKASSGGDSTHATSNDARDGNAAKDRKDPSSDLALDGPADWMSFGDIGSGVDDFEISGASAEEFNVFTFQGDFAPLNDDVQENSILRENASTLASAPNIGLRMFNMDPSAKNDKADKNAPTEDRISLFRPGIEDGNSHESRVIPRGKGVAMADACETTIDSLEVSKVSGDTRLASVSGRFDRPFAQTSREQNDRGGASRVAAEGLPRDLAAGDAQTSLFTPGRQPGKQNPKAPRHREFPAAFSLDRSDTHQDHAADVLDRRLSTAAADGWDPALDPTRGLITANDSTRVIPAAPSATKRAAIFEQSPQLPRPTSVPMSPSEHNQNIVLPSSSVDQNFRSNPIAAEQANQNPDSRGRGTSTPSLASRRGDTSARKVPAVTPGTEASQRAASSFPPAVQNQDSRKSFSFSDLGDSRSSKNARGAAPVTPSQVEDGQVDELRENRDEESSGDRPPSQDLNFEGLHAKFLSDLRDLEDKQEENADRLLAMEDLFATVYAESLQDQARLLGLLGDVESACDMADEMITRFKDF